MKAQIDKLFDRVGTDSNSQGNLSAQIPPGAELVMDIDRSASGDTVSRYYFAYSGDVNGTMSRSIFWADDMLVSSVAFGLTMEQLPVLSQTHLRMFYTTAMLDISGTDHRRPLSGLAIETQYWQVYTLK